MITVYHEKELTMMTITLEKVNDDQSQSLERANYHYCI